MTKTIYVISRILMITLMGAFLGNASTQLNANTEDKEVTNTPFVRIPQEMMIEIFKHVPPKTIIQSVILVSRQWSALALSEELWGTYREKLGLSKVKDVPSRTIVMIALDPNTINLLIDSDTYDWSCEHCIHNYTSTISFLQNEEFLKLGYRRAVSRKIKGLYRGGYGYPKDQKASTDLWATNTQLTLGEMKSDAKSLLQGIRSFVYPFFNDEEGKKIKNSQVLTQNIQNQVLGMAFGWHDYQKDPMLIDHYLELLNDTVK